MHAVRVAGVLAVVGSVALLVAAPAAGSSVSPILIEHTSNIPCSTLDDTYGGGQTWQEIKIDPPGNGSEDGVTVTGFDGDAFDWTSAIGIDAVYVKGGNGGSYLYVYAANANAAESFGDTDLTLPNPANNGISHISFCYDASNPTPSTEPSTAPSTEPSTAPSTEPSTAPSTEPSTAPSTEPSTAPSTAPSVGPGTAVIVVVKLADIDGDPATDDWLPVEDWPFDIEVDGGTPTPAEVVTGPTGEGSSTIAIDDGSADVTVGETLPEDVELLDAECFEVGEGGELGDPIGTLTGNAIGLQVEDGASYECVFINTSGAVEALTPPPGETPPPTDATGGRGSGLGASLPLVLLLLGVVSVVATMLPGRLRIRR
jgi:hypothetical protein